jgi:hypothetical protein
MNERANAYSSKHSRETIAFFVSDDEEMPDRLGPLGDLRQLDLLQ